MRVHRGCPFVRSTRLFSPRINPKTHSETSVLKQVFRIHSGLGLRNAVGNRGLRVRPEPVCRLYTLMRPQFTGLCTHTVWVYVFAVYGLMRPCRMGLCARSLWGCVPVFQEAMASHFTELYLLRREGLYPITAGCVTEPYISSGRYIRRRYRGPLPNQSGLAR